MDPNPPPPRASFLQAQRDVGPPVPPPPAPSSLPQSGAFILTSDRASVQIPKGISEEHVSHMTIMGFDRSESIDALILKKDNFEDAVYHLLESGAQVDADQFSLAPSASRFLASGRLPPAIAAKIPAAPAPPPPDVDSSAFEMLQSMGFSRDLIISTLRSKRNNVDEALSAILGGDGNANDAPPPYANVVGGQAVGVANPEAMNQIMSMGFSREQAIRALSSSENDVERAIEFLFS